MTDSGVVSAEGKATEETTPTVSVITHFLNAGEFLDQAVGSVFAQTYDKWEYLLVDDGSTDASTDIAMTYARQYPDRVRYIDHEGHVNKGMSASKNAGVREARGELIAFLDADDMWLPDKLARQVAVMERNPEVGLVFNRMILWREDGSKVPVRALTLSPGKHRPGAWIREILRNWSNYLSPSTVLIRKSVIMEVGQFEESFRGLLHLVEDVVMWFKISLNAVIYYDPEATIIYREHGSSCWGSSSWEQRQLARTLFFQWFIEYLRRSPHAESLSEIMDAMTFRLTVFELKHFVDTWQTKAAEAVRRWTEAFFETESSDAEWNFLTACCLHQQKISSEEALRRYGIALQNGYDEFWVRYNRGSLHLEQGNIKEAREDLKRAVELDPGHAGARDVFRRLEERANEGLRSGMRRYWCKLFS